MKKKILYIITILVVVFVIGFSLIASHVKATNTIKSIQTMKDSPEELAVFLAELEEDGYLNNKIQNELSNMELTIEHKISIKSMELKYYSVPILSKSEVESYITQNGTNNLYMEAGKGGFYDGLEDKSNRRTVGLSGSPLYEGSSVKYFGDFFVFRQYGVELNKNYEEEHYSKESFFFKDKEIEFDFRNYDCYYSGKYLFAIGENEIYVYDIEANKTYNFSEK